MIRLALGRFGPEENGHRHLPTDPETPGQPRRWSVRAAPPRRRPVREGAGGMPDVDGGGLDRLTVAVLCQYRMATTEQLHRLLAPDVRVEQTRRRLAKLRGEGLVDRVTLPQAGRLRANSRPSTGCGWRRSGRNYGAGGHPGWWLPAPVPERRRTADQEQPGQREAWRRLPALCCLTSCSSSASSSARRAAIRSAISDSTMQRIVGGTRPATRRNRRSRTDPTRQTIKNAGSRPRPARAPRPSHQSPRPARSKMARAHSRQVVRIAVRECAPHRDRFTQREELKSGCGRESSPLDAQHRAHIRGRCGR